MASTNRENPPPLEWKIPSCPICWQPVETDINGYYCERCRCEWMANGSTSHWVDEKHQCKSTHKYINILRNIEEYRCLLSTGHEGYHRTPKMHWKKGATK